MPTIYSRQPADRKWTDKLRNTDISTSIRAWQSLSRLPSRKAWRNHVTKRKKVKFPFFAFLYFASSARVCAWHGFLTAQVASLHAKPNTLAVDLQVKKKSRRGSRCHLLNSTFTKRMSCQAISLDPLFLQVRTKRCKSRSGTVFNHQPTRVYEKCTPF